MRRILRPSLDWLLIFLPATIVYHFAFPDQGTLTFIFACLTIIPLAGWMGKATENLAERTNEGIGGLLNATFGNAAEFIIAIVALRNGLIDIVKASLTGSIIGNILLVLGASFLVGGLRNREQKFNLAGARIRSTLLSLAAIALIAPAAFHHTVDGMGTMNEVTLSVWISVVLLVSYGLGLLFSLKTHRHLFSGSFGTVDEGDGGQAEDSNSTHEPWPLSRAVVVLLGVTAIVAWVSEILVGSVEHAADTFGMNHVFIGVIVVAIIGNAAEHSTAVLMALKNRMDLSLGIAVGSSVQIALFVAPVLVLLSHFVAPEPMDLIFTLPEVIAVGLAVAITSQIADDGESNWLEGVLLLAVYTILGILFFFVPAT